MTRRPAPHLLSRKDLERFFARDIDRHIPHLILDCAVFGFHNSDLKVLLIKWKGMNIWSMPGGYVRKTEPLDAAANRILQVHTGLRNVHLRQFHTFSGLNTSQRPVKQFYAKLGIRVPADAWPLKRLVAVGYYALVDFLRVRPSADYMADTCAWYGVDDRPRLAFDHEEILRSAREALRATLDVPSAGATLLPSRFTMPELQRLHEAILGRQLDRRNFQKKMLDRGDIERLAERRRGGAHRAPFLYRFRSGRAGDPL